MCRHLSVIVLSFLPCLQALPVLVDPVQHLFDHRTSTLEASYPAATASSLPWVKPYPRPDDVLPVHSHSPGIKTSALVVSDPAATPSSLPWVDPVINPDEIVPFPSNFQGIKQETERVTEDETKRIQINSTADLPNPKKREEDPAAKFTAWLVNHIEEAGPAIFETLKREIRKVNKEPRLVKRNNHAEDNNSTEWLLDRIEQARQTMYEFIQSYIEQALNNTQGDLAQEGLQYKDVLPWILTHAKNASEESNEQSNREIFAKLANGIHKRDNYETQHTDLLASQESSDSQDPANRDLVWSMWRLVQQHNEANGKANSVKQDMDLQHTNDEQDDGFFATIEKYLSGLQNKLFKRRGGGGAAGGGGRAASPPPSSGSSSGSSSSGPKSGSSGSASGGSSSAGKDGSPGKSSPPSSDKSGKSSGSKSPSSGEAGSSGKSPSSGKSGSSGKSSSSGKSDSNSSGKKDGGRRAGKAPKTPKHGSKGHPGDGPVSPVRHTSMATTFAAPRYFAGIVAVVVGGFVLV